MATLEILERAKKARNALMISEEKKNEVLLMMAGSIEKNADRILEANKEDVLAAHGKISDVMIDRLRLTYERIKAMADGIRALTRLPDPVGRILRHIERPNGLIIEKVSVPMGVVAIIYESRPNVTSDAAALALKSGNVSVLRSGKEAFRSAYAIVGAMREGLSLADISPDVINLVTDTTRASAAELMTATDYVDLLIPRGGKGLIKACVENATVPCIETGTGICHIYVDDEADLDMALKIIINAKTSRPSVCNAEEVVVVNKKIAHEFLPMLKEALVEERKEDGKIPVELRTDEFAHGIIGGTPASDTDFDTEFLDYILAVKCVDSLEKAIEHIALHSTHHSDAIITENREKAEIFMAMTDSAAVYVNASTRFTDGGEFGLGCEMGISTQKLHARGPMGLEELTTYKYKIYGNGQIR